MNLPRKVLIAVSAVAWVVAVAVGLVVLAGYKTEPGEQAEAPASWPSDSGIAPVGGTSTLVMFIHPKCPCSHASLNELNVIMEREREKARAFIVFLRPAGAEDGWERSASWDNAGRIPNATRVVDHGGDEAQRFGAATSGHTLLYDAAGVLRFAGGITDSRAHEGDNVGRQTVLAIIAEGSAPESAHAVFGCPMQGPSDLAGAGVDTP